MQKKKKGGGIHAACFEVTFSKNNVTKKGGGFGFSNSPRGVGLEGGKKKNKQKNTGT